MEIDPNAQISTAPQSAPPAPKSLVWPLRRSVAFLLVWLGLALWAAYGLAMAWPYELHPLLILLVVALPGVVFRTVDVALVRWRQLRLAGWRRVGSRLAAVPVGVILAMLLFSAAERNSMARFEREIAGWVGRVHAGAPPSCPAVEKHAAEAGLKPYLDDAAAVRKGTLHQGAGRFVLELAGRSIDIDGSTLHYDSATRKWSRFHNDNRERREAFAALVEPLEKCRFTLP